MSDTGQDHSIRFINSSYDTLFRIPDGGTVEIRFPDNVFSAKCEYLDDYHTKIGDTVFHICEFAELLERQNGSVRPEPETALDKAAWQLGHREYLTVQRTEGGFNYELLTQQLKSQIQGQIDDLSKTMNEARDHILETLGMSSRNRHAVSFEEISEKAKAAVKSVLQELNSLQGEASPAVKTGKEKTHVGKDSR